MSTLNPLDITVSRKGEFMDNKSLSDNDHIPKKNINLKDIPILGPKYDPTIRFVPRQISRYNIDSDVRYIDLDAKIILILS